MKEAVPAIGVPEATYYRWRIACDGLKPDQGRRLEQLEQENTRLRHVASDLKPEKLIPRGARRKTIE